MEAADLRNFPVQGANVSPEEFRARLAKYEEITQDLEHIVILLAKWGNEEQLLLLEKIFVRLAEADKGSSGLVVWLHLTWYPLDLLMYAAGISALAAHKYGALRIVLGATIQPDPEYGRQPQKLVLSVTRNMVDLSDRFKWLPGLESKYVPRSEHLYKTLQPILEDELLLGRGYETLFDEFEVFVALAYADFEGGDWGPPGRFGWKHRRGREGSPFEQLVDAAKKEGADWGPLKAGLFGKSADQFQNVATRYRELLKKLSWW